MQNHFYPPGIRYCDVIVSKSPYYYRARFLNGRLTLIQDYFFVRFVFYIPMHCLGSHFVFSLLYLVVRAQQYFVTSSCMFLDQKTVHLTIFRGTFFPGEERFQNFPLCRLRAFSESCVFSDTFLDILVHRRLIRQNNEKTKK